MTSSATGPIVCFGEVLLRLSAMAEQRIDQTRALEMHFGGAEANVALTLSGLGHETRMLTALPERSLGEGALRRLRGHGIDTASIIRGEGRMGLYFLEPGASLRPSEIIYDRADSLFARTAWQDIDWSYALAGAGWLHVSGITPALGPDQAQAVLAAVAAARTHGVRISFDGNYRARLWESWASRPRETLYEIVSHADLFFGNNRDMALLLGRPFDGETPDDRRAAAEAAFSEFARLRWTACTQRTVLSVDCHRLSARVDTREESHETQALEVSGIVDRIGTGDAFAAGVLHALMAEKDAQAAARTGLALAALKHSVPGDAAAFELSEVEQFWAEGGLDVRR